MIKTEYTQDEKTTIFHAMLPSEPEPSVTYVFQTEGGGSMRVMMPKLFIELGDDFERWFEEERHILLRDFQYEYRRNIENRGNYYAKLVYDEFTTAWIKEEYYKDLIGFWESRNTKDLQSKTEALRGKNYEQANYLQKEINKDKNLIFKAKAALYFISQTKAFVKPDFGIPDIVPPVILHISPPVDALTEVDSASKKKKRVNSEAQERYKNVIEKYNLYKKNGHTEKMILDKLVHDFRYEINKGDDDLAKKHRRKQIQKIIRNSKEQ